MAGPLSPENPAKLVPATPRQHAVGIQSKHRAEGGEIRVAARVGGDGGGRPDACRKRRVAVAGTGTAGQSCSAQKSAAQPESTVAVCPANSKVKTRMGPGIGAAV